MINNAESNSSKFEIVFKIRLFLVIGSLLIFNSWLIQNFQENVHKAERESIIEKHRNIEHLFDARRVWLESLYTHQTIKNDSIQMDEIYFLKAYNYIETSFSALSEINSVILKDLNVVNSINNKLDIILDNCESAYANGDYGKLSKIINYINSKKGFDINGKFQQSGLYERTILSNLKDNEEKATKRYLWLYIIGSILIAIDFVFEKYRKLKEEKK